MSVFIVVTTSCIGQDYLDIVKFKNGFVPSNEFEETGHETAVNNFSAKVSYPIVISDKLVFLTGMDYSHINLKLSVDKEVISLMSSGIRLGVAYNHTEKLKGVYIAIPKFTGNYKAGKNKYFQVGGILLWKYKAKENLTYNFGVYVSTEIFSVYSTPILGLYYQSLNKKLEVNLTLPIYADVNYKILKKVRIGADMLALTAGYDLNQYSLASSYVQKTTQEFGGYLQFDIWKSQLILRTKVLYTINDFQLYDDSETIDFGMTGIYFGDNRTKLVDELKSGLGFQVSLAYRFHIKTDEVKK